MKTRRIVSHLGCGIQSATLTDQTDVGGVVTVLANLLTPMLVSASPIAFVPMVAVMMSVPATGDPGGARPGRDGPLARHPHPALWLHGPIARLPGVVRTGGRWKRLIRHRRRRADAEGDADMGRIQAGRPAPGQRGDAGKNQQPTNECSLHKTTPLPFI